MEEIAKSIGSTDRKVRLGVVGLAAIMLGWFLFFAHLGSGVPHKEALVMATGMFWPGTTLLAPALYDFVCKAWGRQD